jgi:3-oxoacyl-[acyl-carrier protein] reductase
MKLTYDAGAALVTGGSGGIGSAIVAALAASGVPVAFTYRRGRETAERLVTAVRAEHAEGVAPVVPYAWDSTAFDAARDLVRRVREDLGPVRFLVFASGIGQEAAFHALDEATARDLVETNLTGAVAATRAVVTAMMKDGAGRVVLVGSVSGRRGIAGHTVYAATKAALEGLARSLAREAGRFGVTVNCVAPGFVDTPMLAALPAPARSEWIARIPLGRLGRPEEVASLVLFLLSREAAYVTGQTYVIDGGVSL